MRRGGDGVTKIRASAGYKVADTIRHARLLKHFEHKVVGEYGSIGWLPHRHLREVE